MLDRFSSNSLTALYEFSPIKGVPKRLKEMTSEPTQSMSHAQIPDHPRTISLTHLIVPDPWEFCRDVQNIAYDWISGRPRGQSVARPFEEPVEDNGDSG